MTFSRMLLWQVQGRGTGRGPIPILSLRPSANPDPFTDQEAAILREPANQPFLVQAQRAGIDAAYGGPNIKKAKATVQEIYIDPSMTGHAINAQGPAEFFDYINSGDMSAIPASAITGALAGGLITEADADRALLRLAYLYKYEGAGEQGQPIPQEILDRFGRV